jgi:hypothetical protein
MSDTKKISRVPLVALAVAALVLAAAVFGMRWWQHRVDRESQALAGIGRVLPGSVTEARKKVDPGRPEKAVLEAIGKPSGAVETRGASRHAVWTYYYADGTMILNLTDGYVARADLEYGPPRLATPGRPE